MNGLRIELLNNVQGFSTDILIHLEIAGRTYVFQVDEPRLGDNINPLAVNPRILSEVGSDVIDTPEKHDKYIYWSIYCQIEGLLCGEALERTMNDVAAVFNRYGVWDNTAERYDQRARREMAVASPPPMRSQIIEEVLRDVRPMMDALTMDTLMNDHAGVPTFAREALEQAYGALGLAGRWAAQQSNNKAAKTAWKLLRQTIGDNLYQDLERQDYFEVQGKRGAYRFHKGKQGGVTFIETRQYGNRSVPVEFDLCIQSTATDLPEGDVILSRYLTWREDEEKFLDTANFRFGRMHDEAAGRL